MVVAARFGTHFPELPPTVWFSLRLDCPDDPEKAPVMPSKSILSRPCVALALDSVVEPEKKPAKHLERFYNNVY